jgi:hypothetical protein
LRLRGPIGWSEVQVEVEGSTGGSEVQVEVEGAGQRWRESPEVKMEELGRREHGGGANDEGEGVARA